MTGNSKEDMVIVAENGIACLTDFAAQLRGEPVIIRDECKELIVGLGDLTDGMGTISLTVPAIAPDPDKIIEDLEPSP